jgi:hypothetical protein
LSYNTAAYLRDRNDIRGMEEPLAKLNGALDAMKEKALG